jgi:hypothetical protein
MSLASVTSAVVCAAQFGNAETQTIRDFSILNWPGCYLIWVFAWSFFQGIRGAVEQHWQNGAKMPGCWSRWIILYIHDFGFRFVCTLAGFQAARVCYLVARHIENWSDVSPGTAAVLAASFIVGVVGIGGQLHYVILLGKLPGLVGGAKEG